MFVLAKVERFKFMAKRKLASILSGVLVSISLVSIATMGLNFGIDFTGGTVIEVEFAQKNDLTLIRNALSKGNFGDITVKYFGENNHVLVNVAPNEDIKASVISDNILDILRTLDQSTQMRRVEFVGPQVGDELTELGGLAILFAMLAILFYVWVRFEWRFSLGSIIALAHDVIITLGVFSLLQIKFDLPVLGAILAVIGYSLNDTIVVYDRIRENFRKMRKGTPEEVVDNSLNQTLARTLMTSLTTLLVLFSLLFLGGEVIYGFSIALITGVVIGTYSSIYVASNAVLTLGVSKKDLAIPVKEDPEKP